MALEFDMIFTRRVIFGRGAVGKIGEAVAEIGLKGRALLVTGRRFARTSGYLDKIRESLESSGFSVKVFEGVEPNPSVETVDRGARIAREANVDFVVGFGGGSAMDAAKAISVVASHGGKAEDYFFDFAHEPVKPPVLPVVAIPTTCGTGSEVTKYSVISKGLEKRTILGEPITPVLSILDAETLRFAPRELIAHTVMDAVSHAVEAYFNKYATEFSDIFAVEALKIIFENFVKGYEGDLDARERLLYGSMLAGLAINIPGTTAAHALGHYLTERYDIPHGLANALFLTQVLEKSCRPVPEKTVKLVEAVERRETRDGEEALRILLRRLREFKEVSNLPMSLKEAGIPEGELDRIVEEGFKYSRLLEKTPKALTREDVEEIVAKAFRGEP